MWCFKTIAMFAACSGLFAAGDGFGEVAAEARVIEILDELELRGRGVRSIQASIVLDKNNELLKDRTVRTGNLIYVSRDKTAPTRFVVLFRQIVSDGRVHDRRLEYIFDGRWFVEKDHHQKRFEKREVVAPDGQENIDLLSFDGPFPLPIGQERNEVLDRFDVGIVVDNAEKIQLHLTPRPDAPVLHEQKRFRSVDIWLNPDTMLPTKVRTDEGATITTVKLSNVAENDAAQLRNASIFDVTPPREGWRVEIKPWED